jgi:OPA family glycerol-3-phosphate transporter-like MFS transporter
MRKNFSLAIPAAGTAAGLTGFFGYVFGSAFAGTGVG